VAGLGLLVKLPAFRCLSVLDGQGLAYLLKSDTEGRTLWREPLRPSERQKIWVVSYQEVVMPKQDTLAFRTAV
jgi:hypothetical protein